MLDSLKSRMKNKSLDEKGATVLDQTLQQSPSPLPAYTPGIIDITAGFSNLSLGTSSALPTRDECIAHLKLLEAIHELRQSVAGHDGCMGINDDLAAGNEEILRKIREKRWAVFVARAVHRFEVWKAHVRSWDPKKINCKTLDSLRDKDLARYQSKSPWSRVDLPPLGKISFPVSPWLSLNERRRRGHGLACLHAQSSNIPRRLPQTAGNDILGQRSTVGSHQRMYRQ